MLPLNLLKKFSVLRVLGLKKAPKFKLFQKCQNWVSNCTGYLKSAVKGCKLNFFGKKCHRGIRNQKVGKVTTFQVWITWRFLSKGQRRVGMNMADLRHLQIW